MAACRSTDANEAEGVRPGHDAPFQCPITLDPLTGRGRVFLHRATGLLLSEKGITQVPKMAQEAIVEAAAAALETASVSAAQRTTLEAVVASGGTRYSRELLVVNPEGKDAEEAKDRVFFVAEKV
jgi:hypothetical protein